ncbi:MAG: ATP-binding protein [Eubacteriales bacterium]|nr:ATP-binding protein [Eubacteriales bacterium]
MNNGSIKVITGIRRSGKSVLLFNLFYDYLISQGISKDHILQYKLDNIKSRVFRDPEKLYDDIFSKMTDLQRYYLFLDEIQFVDDFSELMNSLSQVQNLDVYVTGSNSHFLSSDILTEFRGRGDEVRVYPFSFKEFFTVRGGDKYEAWDEYQTFGGMPALFERHTEEEKTIYLKSLVNKVYISDILERNKIQHENELNSIVDFLCSSIGSLTNPKKISDTLRSLNGKSISTSTAKKYLDCLCDAFLFDYAKRYDVKGKKYFDTPLKYYVTDVGLRNARLNFRQTEENHIMENVIYNELKIRGFSVDVGVVDTREIVNGKRQLKQLEIDFIANKGNKKYYVQSAYALPTTEKVEQEKRSLKKVSDSFKKIVIVKDNVRPQVDENGIVTIGLINFLLDENSLEI